MLATSTALFAKHVCTVLTSFLRLWLLLLLSVLRTIEMIPASDPLLPPTFNIWQVRHCCKPYKAV
jgi:hypothetical protein